MLRKSEAVASLAFVLIYFCRVHLVSFWIFVVWFLILFFYLRLFLLFLRVCVCVWRRRGNALMVAPASSGLLFRRGEVFIILNISSHNIYESVFCRLRLLAWKRSRWNSLVLLVIRITSLTNAQENHFERFSTQKNPEKNEINKQSNRYLLT